MKGLEGIRVVDLSMWVFAPAAGAFLADYGAEVIHVEDLSGDPVRYNIPSPSDPDIFVDSVYYTPTDVPWLFHLVNRGKKSLTLDLRREEGRAVMYKLIETADIFISTIRKLNYNYILIFIRYLKRKVCLILSLCTFQI